MCTCIHYRKGYSCRLTDWLREQRKPTGLFTSGQIQMAIQTLTHQCRRAVNGDGKHE